MKILKRSSVPYKTIVSTGQFWDIVFNLRKAAFLRHERRGALLKAREVNGNVEFQGSNIYPNPVLFYSLIPLLMP